MISNRRIQQLEDELDAIRDDPDLYPDEKTTQSRDIIEELKSIEREEAEMERRREQDESGIY